MSSNSNPRSPQLTVSVGEDDAPSNWAQAFERGRGSSPFFATATAKSGNRLKIRKVAADSLRLGLLADGPGSDAERRRVLSEIYLMRNISHENIVRLYDVSADRKGDLYLVYGFMPKTLQSVINNPKWNLIRRASNVDAMTSPQASPNDIDLVMLILYQILCALKWLHSAGLVHGSLKPSNVLINEPIADFDDVKLAGFCHPRFVHVSWLEPVDSDLGSGSDISSARDDYLLPLTTYNSPPEYVVSLRGRPVRGSQSDADSSIAVECQLGSLVDPAPSADVWAAGCIMAALIRRRPLFTEQTNPSVYLNQLALVCLDRNYGPHNVRQSDDTWRSDLLEEWQADVASEIDLFEVQCADINALQQVHNILSLRQSGSHSVIQGECLDAPHPVCDEGVDVLRRMLRFMPTKRLGVQQVLEHIYFDQVHEDADEAVASQADVQDWSSTPYKQQMKPEQVSTMLKEICEWNSGP